MTSEQPYLTDAQKLELRPALARLHGALLRAWQLGMFVPGSEADRELLRSTRKLVVAPDPQADPNPGLTPLSDEEYLAVFDGLFARFRALADAYRRATSAPHGAERVRPAIPQPAPAVD